MWIGSASVQRPIPEPTAQATSRTLGATDDFRAAVASEAIATGQRRRGHASAAAEQVRSRSKHGPQTTRDQGG